MTNNTIISRLLRKICDATKAEEMVHKFCQGFTVYPPEYFYPIPWWNWTIYFDEQYAQSIKSITKNSYVIHVWNKHSSTKKIKIGSKVPYAMFAEEYCPKVFNECDIYF